MTIFLWFVLGSAAFLFNLLSYILVIYLHDEHPALYKELREPSAFHFLLRPSSLSLHPYTKFILFRGYRAELRQFPGLYGLCQWMVGCIAASLLAALALIAWTA